MSREVRRVPMDWQHPMHWRDRWDTARGESRMQLVPVGLMDDYPAALARWEEEGDQLASRRGHDWMFSVEYHLTGFQGRDDSEPIVHPVYVGEELESEVQVRDENHLHELLTAKHANERPSPEWYMPVFPQGTAIGWCMYETTSEGTPLSPVLDSPEALARWLADTRASAFGGRTATYSQWMRMIDSGWAPSAVAVNGVVQSGVEFVSEPVLCRDQHERLVRTTLAEGPSEVFPVQLTCHLPADHPSTETDGGHRTDSGDRW